MTAAARAATIRACRCGVARTAGHLSPRRPGAGSAVDPAPLAPPVGTSVDPWPPSSATAGLTFSGTHSGATRSEAAGRRRSRRSRPRRRVSGGRPWHPSTWSRTEPLFDDSSSSRFDRPRRRRAGRLARGLRTKPGAWPSAEPLAQQEPRPRQRSRTKPRLRSPSARPNHAGVCGATSRADPTADPAPPGGSAGRRGYLPPRPTAPTTGRWAAFPGSPGASRLRRRAGPPR